MIENGSKVKLNYTGRFQNGDVFDSSLSEGREPLEITIGEGLLIKGFEMGIIGMNVGETKTIEINPENGYGKIREDLIIKIPKLNVPPEVQVGQTLFAENNANVPFEVISINDEEVTLDANHPLAGEILNFDVEILEIDNNS